MCEMVNPSTSKAERVAYASDIKEIFEKILIDSRKMC